MIARPQRWIFVDADRSLLATAFDRTAVWAEGCGLSARLTGHSWAPDLAICSSHGSWHIESLAIDLAKVPRGLPFEEIDGVVCSALLDLTSRRWMERLFAGLRTPFYASLTVDGRDAWFPHHPADLVIRSAFRSDQRRDKGLGVALGIDAAPVAGEVLAKSGFETFMATSDWRIPRGERSLGRLFARITAQAARRAAPERASKIAQWTKARLGHAAQARLAIRIGHRDILAFPPN
jgi:hypothetical protein